MGSKEASATSLRASGLCVTWYSRESGLTRNLGTSSHSFTDSSWWLVGKDRRKITDIRVIICAVRVMKSYGYGERFLGSVHPRLQVR
jgi:hypothetical protein